MSSEIDDPQAQLDETEATIKALRDQLKSMERRREDLVLLLAEKRLHAQVDDGGGIVAALRHWNEIHGRDGVDLRKPMQAWLRTIDPHLIWSTQNDNDKHSRRGDYMIRYWARRQSTPQEVTATADALTTLGRELREAKATDPELRWITVGVVHEDEPHQFSYDDSVSVRLRLTASGWELVTPNPPVAVIATAGDDCLPLLEQARTMTLAVEQ